MSSPYLHPDEQVTVSHQFQQALSNTAEWLQVAASTLARLTSEAAIVTPPTTPSAMLRHIEAVPINERRVLLVVVLEGGAVEQQLLELRTPLAADQLRTLSARLTARLAGKGAAEVLALMVDEQGVDAEVASAVARVLGAHDVERTTDVVYDGVQNIIAQPEFAATGRIRDMLGLLEDRARIVEILPPALGADEVHVSIGSEHHVELLRDCSLIVGRYGAAGD